MRTAKIADYWRAVYAERYPIRLDRTEFASVIGIGTGNIEFAGAITAICGNNGVGKSTLLNAVFGSVCNPDVHDVLGPRFVGASLTASLTTNAASVNVGTTFNPSARTITPLAVNHNQLKNVALLNRAGCLR